MPLAQVLPWQLVETRLDGAGTCLARLHVSRLLPKQIPTAAGYEMRSADIPGGALKCLSQSWISHQTAFSFLAQSRVGSASTGKAKFRN